MIACQPACTAPNAVALLMAGQGDVVRCPDQRFADSAEAVAAVRRCMLDATTARRPFISQISVGAPFRGSSTRYLLGRVNSGEFEVVDVLDLDVPSANSRVLGARCDGFSDFVCMPRSSGIACDPVCTARIVEAPTPPYDRAATSGEVWCGPAYR
jgi:hypothetical protein